MSESGQGRDRIKLTDCCINLWHFGGFQGGTPLEGVLTFLIAGEWCGVQGSGRRGDCFSERSNTPYYLKSLATRCLKAPVSRIFFQISESLKYHSLQQYQNPGLQWQLEFFVGSWSFSLEVSRRVTQTAERASRKLSLHICFFKLLRAM